MAIKVGYEMKLFRQTSGARAAWPGTGAAPNLDEVVNVANLSRTRSRDVVDVTTRAQNGYRAEKPTLKTAGFECDMKYDSADADFTAFATAYESGAAIAFALLDGLSTVTGTKGFWADFYIVGFDSEEPIDGVVTVKVKATIADVGATGVATVAPENVSVVAA